MKVVIVGGGSWGTAFARVLQNREHDVTLACRDAEQARAIAETGRNPRYLPHCNLRGVEATTIEDAPLTDADADRASPCRAPCTAPSSSRSRATHRSSR